MKHSISEGRTIAYYIGTTLMISGGLSFFSVFLTAALNSGDFGNPHTTKSTVLRALFGMVLLMIGGVVRSIGVSGLADSGVMLDPKKAREEPEPYSRMAGAMLEGALGEVQRNLNGNNKKGVMIKCQNCGQLNEGDRMFCKECGRAR